MDVILILVLMLMLMLMLEELDTSKLEGAKVFIPFRHPLTCVVRGQVSKYHVYKRSVLQFIVCRVFLMCNKPLVAMISTLSINLPQLLNFIIVWGQDGTDMSKSNT